MPRQRSIACIHRWSRPIMAGLATIGAVVTAYLTYIKITGNEAACPTGGCDVVLSSPYATVFGLPLALFGFLAYASMVIFAIAPLVFNPAKGSVASEFSRRKHLPDRLESWTGLPLFMGATAMMVFSGYLMYLLVFKIQAVCLYCVGSAILSTGLFILALIGREWLDIGQLLFTGTLVGVIVLVGTLGVYAHIDNPEIANRAVPGQAGPPITTPSGKAEKALAEHLKQVGAKMYGAFWCPHCHDQKQLFGKEAFSQITYIECDPNGKNPQPDLCKAANVLSYPTWEVKGQMAAGAQPLEKLGALSDYQGSLNFQNKLPGG